MPFLLLALPTLLGAFERFEEVEGGRQAGYKAKEDDACDHGVNRTPGHVDQKLYQHHQRDKGEEQREDTHVVKFSRQRLASSNNPEVGDGRQLESGAGCGSNQFSALAIGCVDKPTDG